MAPGRRHGRRRSVRPGHARAASARPGRRRRNRDRPRRRARRCRLEHRGQLETRAASDVEHAAGTTLDHRPGQHVHDQRFESLGDAARSARRVRQRHPAVPAGGEHRRHLAVDGGVQPGKALVPRPHQVVLHDRPAAASEMPGRPSPPLSTPADAATRRKATSRSSSTAPTRRRVGRGGVPASQASSRPVSTAAAHRWRRMATRPSRVARSRAAGCPARTIFHSVPGLTSAGMRATSGGCAQRRDARGRQPLSPARSPARPPARRPPASAAACGRRTRCRP